MDTIITSQLLTLVVSLLTILIVTITGRLFLAHHRFTKHRNSLSSVAGPTPKFFTGNTSLFVDVVTNKISTSVTWNALLGLSKKYPGIYKLSFGFDTFVHVFTPSGVEAILSKSSLIEKGSEYWVMGKWLGNGLLTSSGDKWRTHRKLLTSTFHFKILEQFVPVINDHSMVLRDILGQRTDQKTDIVSLISYCLLDIIMESAMGLKGHSSQLQPNLPYVKAIHRFGELALEHFTNPLYFWWPIFDWSPKGAEFRRQVTILRQFTEDIIRARIAETSNSSTSNQTVDETQFETGSKKKLALLDLLLEHHFKGQLTETEVREQVDTFAFAGHDTTGLGSSFALYLIGRHPEVQSKVHQELDDIFGEDKNRPVTTSDVKRLAYLEAVLKESLRLYPSAPLILRNLSEDVVLDGHLIPAGTDVAVPIFLLHRNEDEWPQPEHFDPERFLNRSASVRHPFAYCPFSAGPRNCIGQKFALLEEKIVVANVLRKYRCESLDEPYDLQLSMELVLRPKRGLRVKFIER